jgi:hypothetical protein
MKSRRRVGLQECEHDICMRCAKEREVKESVRIELLKALQRDSLNGKDIARSGFITTEKKSKKKSSRSVSRSKN